MRIIEKHLNDTTYSMSAGLSRIEYYLKKGPCCFITSYKEVSSEISNSLNKKRFKELSRDLETLGYGHINLMGKFENVKERSMFVTMAANTSGPLDEFIKCMDALRKKYDQKSILISIPGEKAYFLEANNKQVPVGDFHIKNLDQVLGKYYSQIKGKFFVFEDDVIFKWHSDIKTFEGCSLMDKYAFHIARKNFLV